METVICDASSLISLSDTCYLNILKLFKKQVRFIIPRIVEYEAITRPMKIRQYSLHAHRLRRLIKNKNMDIIEDNTTLLNDIMNTGNNIFYRKGKSIHLIDKGECGMIACTIERDIRYMLIDERTTRTLVEAPDVLKKHFEKEFHVHITTNIENLEKFTQMTKNLKILRSSELVIFAYKKGYFDSFSDPKTVLKSALYRLKYTGCSLSFEEIDDYISSVK